MDTNTQRRGHQYKTRTLNLPAFADLYFMHSENTLKPGTLASYRQSIRQFVEFCGGTTDDLTDLQIVRWMRKRLQEGTSPNTVRGDHRRLSAWLTWGNERGIIERNWAKLAKPPSEPDEPGRAISEVDFMRLIGYTKGTRSELRDRALLWLLWDTGMRIGEASKLQIPMLSLLGDNPIIHLPAAITKTNQARVVPVGRECQLAVYDYMALDLKKVEGQEGYLFVNSRTGNPWHEQTGKHIVRELGKLAGVEVGAHDFRRSFVGRMQKAGMSDTMIMRLTGHKTIAMIQRYGAPNAQENAILAYRRAMSG